MTASVAMHPYQSPRQRSFLRGGLILTLCVLGMLAPPTARAQETTPAGLRVFLDCQQHVPGCDFDYLRTQMTWIEWVRNRQDAGVHLLMTTQETGAGGRSYTMMLIGQADFANRTDTLTFASPPATTDDERRQLVARWIRIGLLPFAAHTALAPGLDVAYAGPPGANRAQTRPTNDPWNYWVFEVEAGTSLEGESLQQSSSLEGGVTARRVTRRWKLDLSLDGHYDESRYTLAEDSTTTAIQRRYGFDGLAVRSLGGHWSVGLVGSTSSSTYSNQKLAVRVAPGLEYDIFPYGESTSQQLTFLYTLGPRYYDYEEQTLYGKLQDRILDQTLDVSLSLRQPWGTVYSAVQGRHIVHWQPAVTTAQASAAAQAAKYRLSWRGDVEVNLVRGLSLNLHGRYSRVHDQITLPAGEASDEEILLQLRELQTDYTYRFSVGLSYTFGSIHNDIVNPRFDSY